MTDTTVKISLSAIRVNARAIVEKYPDYDHYIGVVKGDAYGHGYAAVSAMREGGIDTFSVSSLEEAAAFREHDPDSDLLCLEPVLLARLDEAAALGLILPVCDTAYLDALLSSGVSYPFRLHLQIDAGFNRLGFKDRAEIRNAVQRIAASPYTLDGVYQHFATSGLFDPHYDAQVRRFKELTADLDLARIPAVHLGSGVSLLIHPKIDIANTARMGLILYGYNVSPSSYGRGLSDRLRAVRDRYYIRKYHISPTYRDVELDLIPAMRFSCRILQLKDVSAGEYIGYGAAFRAEHDMRIAVLPVGYNNGIGHANHGRMVQINDSLYPVVGEIGMNMLCVEVDDSVALNDEVILLGGRITLGMFSRASGLGLAEALVAIGKQNPRVYE